ncbi:7919_t:CDS:1 [Diversispora eburnea]|uniref:7919_t:CDS:1 n=1 Tax=Diversispora eburnea TaxID=1213867 RepID=A0A9N9BL80_9GLOM|nr:7919_t:CDS:1 [Diversispora eburnea]
MGSMKSQSLRYEVLVCPQKEHTLVQTKEEMASSNSVQPFLTQTQVRRFTIDENMQQYWIPDGYHPVLVPRPFIQYSIAANSQQTAVSAGNEFNNIICPLRQTISSINTFGGNVTHRTKRRRLLGSQQNQIMASSPSKVSLITFYAASLYYKQKLKELITSGVISNPPSEPPSKIIGKMWYEEPESTRKYYERLVIRLKTLKCENDNNKKLGRRPPIYKHQFNPNSRYESRFAQARSQRKQYHRSNLPHEHPIKRPSGALDISNKYYNESNVYTTSSEDFTKFNVPVTSYRRSNNKNVSNTEGGNSSSVEHQFSMMNADDLCRESFIISSSPKLSANRINNDNVNDAHNADWMTRSDEEDLCDTDDTNY